jgi:hypothetical protein
MKAEPESRFEKGHDIKFSIDDLASKTEPEPWDGEHYGIVLITSFLTDVQVYEHMPVYTEHRFRNLVTANGHSEE